MNALVQDLRFALRTLRRPPGYTLIAVVTLGLGIGATTTIFSIVNGLVIRPLPVKNPHALPGVAPAAASNGVPIGQEAGGVPIAAAGGEHSVMHGEEPLAGFRSVTDDYFHTLGIPLRSGWVFRPRENAERSGVCAVNEKVARKLSPTVGRRLRVISD